MDVLKDAREWLRCLDDPKRGYVRRDPQTNLIRALAAEVEKLRDAPPKYLIPEM